MNSYYLIQDDSFFIPYISVPDINSNVNPCNNQIQTYKIDKQNDWEDRNIDMG